MTVAGAALSALVLAGLGVGPASAAPPPPPAGAKVVTAAAPALLPAATPRKVVGNGTPASCTADALWTLMKAGGHITFSCGPNPVTIPVTKTLRVCNTHTCKHEWQGGRPVTDLVIDGGGKVTLDGLGQRTIFYASTCDAKLGWVSSRCQDETAPRVTFKDITFTRGNGTRPPTPYAGVGGGGGGGAIAMRGGRLTLDGVTFIQNRCMTAHSDAGGGAVRVVGVKGGVRVADSRFWNNRCANGGAISSLQSPLDVVDSRFTANAATGRGASSGKGGNGGAVYFDGTNQDVSLGRVHIVGNVANEGGPAVFYVSNNRTGKLRIVYSTFERNRGEKFWTRPYRSIFYLGKGSIQVAASTLQ